MPERHETTMPEQDHTATPAVRLLARRQVVELPVRASSLHAQKRSAEATEGSSSAPPGPLAVAKDKLQPSGNAPIEAAEQTAVIHAGEEALPKNNMENVAIPHETAMSSAETPTTHEEVPVATHTEHTQRDERTGHTEAQPPVDVSRDHAALPALERGPALDTPHERKPPALALETQQGYAGAEHEGEVHDKEEEESLFHVFRERVINVVNMDHPLRIITGLAFAQLGVTVILIAIRDFHLLKPDFTVNFVGTILVQMPQPVFWTVLTFLLLAWSYLLSGALRAHWTVRIAGLVLFTLSMLPLVYAAADQLSIFLVSCGVILALWIVGLGSWLYDRRLARQGVNTIQTRQTNLVRSLTSALVFILIMTLYGVTFLALGTTDVLFSEAISVQLGALSLLLIPVLVLAGVDFADWGEVTMERVALLIQRTRSPLLLAAATTLVALAILGNFVLTYKGSVGEQLLPHIAMGAVTVGLLMLLVRLAHMKGEGWPKRVPYAALALSAIATALVLFAVSATQVTSAYKTAPSPKTVFPGGATVFSYERQPPFSINYPADWEIVRDPDNSANGLTDIHFRGQVVDDQAFFIVATFPLELFPHPNRYIIVDALQACCAKGAIHITPAPSQDSWQVAHFLYLQTQSSNLTVEGIAWQRIAGNRVWLLYGAALSENFQTYAPLFTAMTRSWKPQTAPAESKPAEATATDSGANVEDAFLGIFWLVVTLVASTLLIVRSRRGRIGSLLAASLFVASIGLFYIGTNLPQMMLVFFGVPLNRVPSLSLAGDQATVAIATLAVLAWLVARRQVTTDLVQPLILLFTLNAALEILSLLYDLYSRAIVAGQFSVPQAIIILVALSWDVTMSGEEITNVHGRIFPRQARVLLFFGYIMLVATVVLYSSSLSTQATGKPVASLFESELWPQSGLLELGVPLLITLFILKFVRWSAERPPAEKSLGGSAGSYASEEKAVPSQQSG